MRNWWRNRSLTLVLLGCFLLFTVGQMIAGWHEYNAERTLHEVATVRGLAEYLGTGHFWEALFENWESEFLQMAAFVILTTMLIQRGSPESRKPSGVEDVDADPRKHAKARGAPWPVRRGGWLLWCYERSLGIVFLALFLLSWIGHAVGGWHEQVADDVLHAVTPPTFAGYIASSRFWFESLQNWQSEFLAIAAMVWLSVYLRQRGSPESKPVHAPHNETGR